MGRSISASNILCVLILLHHLWEGACRRTGHRIQGGQETTFQSPGFTHYISVARVEARSKIVQETLCGATAIAIRLTIYETDWKLQNF